MELMDKLMYKGVEFIFDACADVKAVAKKLEDAGECPGIMNSVYERRVQGDGSVMYSFANGEDLGRG